MPKEFVFHVKGSEPDPYTVKVSLPPLKISCTCQAGENGRICKHRKMILEGADPGIVKGDKTALAEIAAAGAGSGVSSLLEAYDAAQAGKKAADDRADKAFRKYRDARVDLLMQRVKTDRAVIKARDGMEAAIESVITEYTAAETALAALRVIFTRPDGYEV
jgi:hypothetical protein